MANETTGPKRIWKSLAISALAAIIATVLFVMPAEYGRDPTGVGGLLGLTALAGSDSAPTAALEMEGAFPAIVQDFDEYEPPLIGLPFSNPNDQPYSVEELTITLQPGEQVEYKAVMERGQMLVFTWSSDAPEIYSDFHADPTDKPGEYPEGYFVRYAESEESAGHGSIVAPFAGNHGWYWLNYNEQTVNIELKVAGYYDNLHELGRSFQY